MDNGSASIRCLTPSRRGPLGPPGFLRVAPLSVGHGHRPAHPGVDATLIVLDTGGRLDVAGVGRPGGEHVRCRQVLAFGRFDGSSRRVVETGNYPAPELGDFGAPERALAARALTLALRQTIKVIAENARPPSGTETNEFFFIGWQPRLTLSNPSVESRSRCSSAARRPSNPGRKRAALSAASTSRIPPSLRR